MAGQRHSMRQSCMSVVVRMRSAAAVCCVVVTGSVSLAADGPQLQKRVLFVGNSYTAQTLASVQAFADADITVSLYANLAAVGGTDLAFHYANRFNPVYFGGAASLLDMLRSAPWDIVVLQDLSIRPTRIGNPVGFMTDCANLRAFIQQEAPTAEVWFFETWARRSDSPLYPGSFPSPVEMQSDLRNNYSQAAIDTGGRMIPVGDAWERTYTLRPFDPNAAPVFYFSLHIGDSSHPSERGRYLTGAVMYEAIFNRSSMGSVYFGDLGCADANFLRRMATETTGAPPTDSQFPPVCCPGDANGDGIIGFPDLNIVLGTFGATGFGLDGDLNGDNVVGFPDLNIVLSAFGNSCVIAP